MEFAEILFSLKWAVRGVSVETRRFSGDLRWFEDLRRSKMWWLRVMKREIREMRMESRKCWKVYEKIANDLVSCYSLVKNLCEFKLHPIFSPTTPTILLNKFHISTLPASEIESKSRFHWYFFPFLFWIPKKIEWMEI